MADSRSLISRLQSATHTALHQNNHAPLRDALDSVQQCVHSLELEDSREVLHAVLSLAPLVIDKFPSSEGARMLDGIVFGGARSEDAFSTLVSALRLKEVIQPEPAGSSRSRGGPASLLLDAGASDDAERISSSFSFLEVAPPSLLSQKLEAVAASASAATSSASSKHSKRRKKKQQTRATVRGMHLMALSLLEQFFTPPGSSSISQSSPRLYDLLDFLVSDDARLTQANSTHTPSEGPALLAAKAVALCADLCAVPDLATVCLHRDVPPNFRHPSYYRSLVRMVCNYLESHDKALGKVSVVGLSELIGKLSRLGQSACVMEEVCVRVASHVRQGSAKLSSRYELLLSLVPTSSLPRLVEAAIRCVGSETLGFPVQYAARFGILPALFRDTMRSNDVVRSSVTNTLLFSKVLPLRCLDFIVDLLSKSSSDFKLASKLSPSTQLSLSEHTLESCATAWNSRALIRHSALDQHAYITQAIVRLLRLLQAGTSDGEAPLPSSGIGANPSLLSELLSGVQMRLENAITDVRHCGMIVAETFSVILHPSEPLNFSELRGSSIEADTDLKPLPDKPPHYWKNSSARDAEPEGRDTSTKSAPMVGEAKDRPTEVRVPVRRKPAKVLIQAVDGDEESDSDDSLADFDIDARFSGKEEVLPPRYIRDVWRYLRETEKPDYIEAGLEAAESLIRSPLSHGDLEHSIGVGLMKTLLHLNDQYKSPNFVELRYRALNALVCTIPRVVAPFLTHAFYADNYTVSERMDMLDILCEAAQSLSAASTDTRDHLSLKEATAAAEKGGGRMPIRPLSSTVTKKQRERFDAIQARVEKNTRRWGVTTLRKLAESSGSGSTNTSSSNRQTRNRFAEVAGVFFYPLLEKADLDNPRLNILGTESLLLAHLVSALGKMIECAGNTPPTPRMSRALFDLLWATRFHAQAAVRRATVFAFSRVLLALPKHVLMQQFGDELSDMLQWLVALQMKDPDAECREISRLCLLTLQELVDPGFQ